MPNTRRLKVRDVRALVRLTREIAEMLAAGMDWRLHVVQRLRLLLRARIGCGFVRFSASAARGPRPPVDQTHGAANSPWARQISSRIPLPGGAGISCLQFGRFRSDRPFRRRERMILRMFHRELVHLWRAPAGPANGDENTVEASDGPRLPPRLRQTLALLGEGLSEKQIAVRLRLSPHTVHDYVKPCTGDSRCRAAASCSCAAAHPMSFFSTNEPGA